MAGTVADTGPASGVAAPSRTQPPAPRRITGPSANSRLVAERVAKLRHARDALRRAAAAPLPRSLAPARRAEVERYNKWLRQAANRLDALARRGQVLLRPSGKSTPIAAQRHFDQRHFEEMNQSFNMQYLMLQQKMQSDNRRFTLLSNIMKIKHDTAKNAINNVR